MMNFCNSVIWQFHDSNVKKKKEKIKLTKHTTVYRR